ncbi:signal peptidase I [Simiduia curdlanivorans]|uniref:Signal peptidase I n=1 Tax=Simiduia curdlanivorans TaxID=1492769 RepID=A0ABV8V7J9_9GAMM|nr:signal peptidase I [Simiduia curdlanivorans]MDN3639801.1 signal peptidase I [Simiduia curdlanivorans]
MDINFPLILVLLVFFSGLGWLYDIAFLAKARKAKVENTLKELSEKSLKETDQGYQLALEAASKEPLVVEYSKSFFPVLAFVLVLRSFLVEPFQIPSASMVPTLQVGDFILVNKFAYGIRLPVTNTKIIDVGEPQRGDVMVFFPPHKPDTYFIKRVLGLPGDSIRLENGTFTINGSRVPTELLAQLPVGRPQFQVLKETLGEGSHEIHRALVPGSLSQQGQWEVPAGHYLMVGDNRDNSSDGRDWGFVSEDAIVGQAFAIWMHWEKMLSLPSFQRLGSIQ